MRTPTARASGLAVFEIVVDTKEKYAYRFSAQQATTVKAALACGDDGVRHGDRQAAAAGTPEIRAWALGQGLTVSDRGRLRAGVLAAFHQAHG